MILIDEIQVVPEVNVQFIKDAVVPQQSVDVSVAVATESGLITPIVPNADLLGVSQISSKIKVRHSLTVAIGCTAETWPPDGALNYGVKYKTCIDFCKPDQAIQSVVLSIYMLQR